MFNQFAPFAALTHVRPHPQTVAERLWALSWIPLTLIIVIAGIGIAMLYSVAGGSIEPWAISHALRFIIALALLFATVALPLRFWLGAAYPIYLANLLLLAAVPWAGNETGGATRWILVAGLSVQPAEMMKVAVALALARYFQWVPVASLSRPLYLIPPLTLVTAPVVLILLQPDLGTAGIVLIIGVTMIFLAGLSWLYFIGAGIMTAIAAPYLWQVLQPYQRQRIATFLEPDRDLLGSGYQIFQSKIALGSGGWTGKGYIAGTQNQLDFLPEKHTDFIFTILAEELGFVGAGSLMVLYGILVIFLIAVAVRCQSHFARLLAAAASIYIFSHSFLNMAMVMGLMPVVGMPLPLVSYGGTSLIATMIILGLAMNAYVHRHERIFRENLEPMW